jgi:hypothetical protein
MNIKHLTLLAALGLSMAHGVVYADPGDIDPTAGFVSTKSRAEVVAELVAARAAGQLRYGEAASEPPARHAPTKSRAQVRAELREAQRLGLVGSRGDAEPSVPTAEQIERIRAAGARADAELIAKR